MLIVNLVAYGSLVIILTLIFTSKKIDEETGKTVLAVHSSVRIMLVIWTMIGISLPKYLGLRFTKQLYYKLEKIDMEKIKANAKSDKKVRNHIAKFRYESTNTNVAEVSSKGVVKAIGKGKTVIYVFGQNGISQKIKVAVK